VPAGDHAQGRRAQPTPTAVVVVSVRQRRADRGHGRRLHVDGGRGDAVTGDESEMALPAERHRTLQDAGVTVLEGWGLTETTAPATVNTPDRIRIGSVGLPLPGVTVRVADDGELLVRGVGVLRGYFRNPGATAEALEDGWFRTGDLGEIDDDGYVRITGRKKEIIVTAGGKNVAPSILEDRLRAHALDSQCMVVGDQRPYVAALVTLDPEMLPTWLANSGKPPMDLAAAARDPDVRAEVQRAVDHANQAVSTAESIRSFLVLDTDFTEAGGHLTPKLSLKRAVVLKEFAAQVDQLYS